MRVLGNAKGDVRSKGSVFVGSGGTLSGDVEADSFAMEDGANFSGRVEADVDLPDALLELVGEKTGRK